MEATMELAVQTVDCTDGSAAVAIPADVEELYRNRLRFDGLFTGPTW
jgi:hypothetical protein